MTRSFVSDPIDSGSVVSALVVSAFAVCWLGLAPWALGQGGQTLVTAPQMSVNDSFYESYGVGPFGFQRSGPGGNAFFNRGPLNAAPAFGGFAPNAGGSFGVGGVGGSGGFSFGFAQGSSRSIVGQSASVMVPNGGSGAIFSGSVRPFVTGLVPVVAAGSPTWINPVEQSLQRMRERGETLSSLSARKPASPMPSTASASTTPPTLTVDAPLVLGAGPTEEPAMRSDGAPMGSLSELRKRNQAAAAEQREQARQRIVQGRAAESAGKWAVAANHYRLALRQVGQDDPWHDKILERLAVIRHAKTRDLNDDKTPADHSAASR